MKLNKLLSFLKITGLISAMVLSPFFTVATADSLEGYKSPQDAINAFINPLKQGSKGIPEAMKAAKGLNGESMDYANSSLKDGPKYGQTDELESSLKKDIKEYGKLEKATLVDNYSRLNGHMQTFEYELKYIGGKKRNVTITVIKPTTSGGYHVMGIKPND